MKKILKQMIGCGSYKKYDFERRSKKQSYGFCLLFCVSLFFSLMSVCEARANLFPTSIGLSGKSLETENGEPWRIFADELVSINDGLVLEGRGNVLLVRENDYLKADFARLYTNTEWVLLQGNVFAKLGVDELQASEAEFDLKNTSGWVRDAKIFMAGPHMYFSSKELYKTEGDVYHLQEAVVTACDGDSPLWSVSAVEAIVESDSYAHLTHPVFNVKSQKLIYSPYLVVPTKTTRQSGFLLPEYGVSSEHGVYYTQPYFHVIDQSRDLTVYATILTERGFMPSIEYRSHTKENQKMWMALDVLYDQKLVLNDKLDPINSRDGLIRDNRFRFWLRGMADGDILESEWKYKYNIDLVSDQNFLHEYKNRMTGYDASRDYTFNMFGRDFAEIDENRISQGYIYRDWELFSIAAGFRYEQDPSYNNGNKSISDDDTVQRLPEVYAFWNRGKLLQNLPVELNASLQTGYMYRREGTSGMRTEIYPELHVPFDLKYATLEVNAGARATIYSNTSESQNSPLSGSTAREKQTGSGRVLPEFGFNLYSQASRTWDWAKSLEATKQNVGKSQYSGMRHTFQPRLEYTWIDDINQENNPFYILEDRIQGKNDLTLTLDNRFTFRKDSVARKGEGFELKTSYHDLLRAQLYWGYDFREENRRRHTDKYENRPMHDVHLRLRSQPLKWLSLNSSTYYSLYDNEVNRSDTGVSLHHSRFGSFSSSYSWRHQNYNYRNFVNYENINDIIPSGDINVITNSVSLNLSSSFRLSAMETRDLFDGDIYERRLGLSFLHQCVRINAEYLMDATEERVQVSVELMGLNF